MGDDERATPEHSSIEEIRRGVWLVATPWRPPAEIATGASTRMTRIDPHPDPARAARLRTAGALIADTAHGATDAALRRLCEGGQQMTALIQYPSGLVVAHEGTGLLHDYLGTCLKNKGAQTRGIAVGDERASVLDVREGYGHAAELAAWWEHRLAGVPNLEAATFDDLPRHDGLGEPPSAIAAAYLMDGPDLERTGSPPPGCMFLATDYDNEADIVNGYLWAPSGCALESEHGSFYGRDIAARGGRLADYRPASLSFGYCLWGGLGTHRVEAYRRVAGRLNPGVYFLGHLTHDPEPTVVDEDGAGVLTLRVRVDQSQRHNIDSDYVDVRCYGSDADVALGRVGEGSPIRVSGELVQETWTHPETDDAWRQRHYVNAHNIDYVVPERLQRAAEATAIDDLDARSHSRRSEQDLGI